MKLHTMKLTLVLLLCTLHALAGEQPKFFKKARKTQATLIAYTATGEMRQAQAVFLDETGNCAAPYDAVKMATRATLVDADGKEHQVRYVMGASSLYNAVRMQSNNTKSNYAEVRKSPLAKGTPVWVMPLAGAEKQAQAYSDTISEAQVFGEGDFPYYTLSKPADERMAGCPVYDEEGALVGFIQPAARKADKPAFVLGAAYVSSLSITTFDANNSDLSAILIDKALPDDETQATSYLFLSTRLPDDAYERLAEQFVERFPHNANGYIQLAERQVAAKKYKAAEATYSRALDASTGQVCDIHHSYAKMLYRTAISATKSTEQEGWTLERALSEAEAAYAASPQPLYAALQGMCLYGLKRYDTALDRFLSLSATNMRSAEYFAYAAQCKEMMQAPAEEVLALQDSAVNIFSKPYPVEAANFLYFRAQTRAKLKQFREAVSDLNEFEHLLSGNVTAQFCYEREQLEMQCRLFPAALSDIERAVRLAPNEPLFRAEEAVVNYRVGQLDEAIKAAQEAVRLDDTFADAHRILGICLSEKGKKEEARKSLLRAQELGDATAKKILDNL
ncbi:MAG: tetratricopeptide repeat protein [Bacteroidales bacterium]|nr:tetratricopeptide repeat protein [Candidatus Physcousia equi]